MSLRRFLGRDAESIRQTSDENLRQEFENQILSRNSTSYYDEFTPLLMPALIGIILGSSLYYAERKSHELRL